MILNQKDKKICDKYSVIQQIIWRRFRQFIRRQVQVLTV